MNLSLCCISNALANEGTRFRRITYKSFSSISKNEAINKIGLIALHNLEVCFKTIKQCVNIGISGYRISSDLFPLLNHPDICMKIDDLPNIDYYKILMQEVEDNKMWIEEYMKKNKPKKKLDKKKLNKDIFEIDFMCD